MECTLNMFSLHLATRPLLYTSRQIKRTKGLHTKDEVTVGQGHDQQAASGRTFPPLLCVMLDSWLCVWEGKQK
jgi:hypothetical protein